MSSPLGRLSQPSFEQTFEKGAPSMAEHKHTTKDIFLLICQLLVSITLFTKEKTSLNQLEPPHQRFFSAAAFLSVMIQRAFSCSSDKTTPRALAFLISLLIAFVISKSGGSLLVLVYLARDATKQYISAFFSKKEGFLKLKKKLTKGFEPSTFCLGGRRATIAPRKLACNSTYFLYICFLLNSFPHNIILSAKNHAKNNQEWNFINLFKPP